MCLRRERLAPVRYLMLLDGSRVGKCLWVFAAAEDAGAESEPIVAVFEHDMRDGGYCLRQNAGGRTHVPLLFNIGLVKSFSTHGGEDRYLLKIPSLAPVSP